jgi:UDP-GlcNAc:undecaprenyl-phosphate GlcNAc-1-phosphate transferase
LRTAAVAFLSSAAVAAAVTPVVRAAACRWNVLDHALTSRKEHGRPIPRLGGIAIVLAFYAPLAALYFVNSDVGSRFWSEPRKALGLIVGGLAIAVLGVYDDLKGADAKKKFAVQFAVAGLMYWLGFRFDIIGNPFGTPIQLGWFSLPVTIVFIAGVINAMNLIDGLDGLAGGVAFIAIATVFVMANLHDQPLMLLFCAALGGAVLGFLFYNFNPATIFMGDTGSMFLGFVLATTAIQTNEKSTATVAIAVPILALGVPIADTLLAMGRRYIRGVPMFSADRGHIHHRLLGMGLSQRQAVVVIYVASATLGGAALLLSFGSSRTAAVTLVVLSILVFLALRRLGFVDLDKTRALLSDRKRNLELRGVVRKAGERISRAGQWEDVWSALVDAAPGLGAVGVALSVAVDGGSRLEFSQGLEADGLLVARYGLVVERPEDDWLTFGFDDSRASVDRDLEIAIELLCERLADAVDRLVKNGG